MICTSGIAGAAIGDGTAATGFSGLDDARAFGASLVFALGLLFSTGAGVACGFATFCVTVGLPAGATPFGFFFASTACAFAYAEVLPFADVAAEAAGFFPMPFFTVAGADFGLAVDFGFAAGFVAVFAIGFELAFDFAKAVGAAALAFGFTGDFVLDFTDFGSPDFCAGACDLDFCAIFLPTCFAAGFGAAFGFGFFAGTGFTLAGARAAALLVDFDAALRALAIMGSEV